MRILGARATTGTVVTAGPSSVLGRATIASLSVWMIDTGKLQSDMDMLQTDTSNASWYGMRLKTDIVVTADRFFFFFFFFFFLFWACAHRFLVCVNEIYW